MLDTIHPAFKQSEKSLDVAEEHTNGNMEASTRRRRMYIAKKVAKVALHNIAFPLA